MESLLESVHLILIVLMRYSLAKSTSRLDESWDVCLRRFSSKQRFCLTIISRWTDLKMYIKSLHAVITRPGRKVTKSTAFLNENLFLVSLAFNNTFRNVCRLRPCFSEVDSGHPWLKQSWQPWGPYLPDTQTKTRLFLETEALLIGLLEKRT